jgi:CRP-like cAMP-binding protein
MNLFAFKENIISKLNLLLESGIKEEIQLISVKRNINLLEEGQKCLYYYFLIEGVVRNFNLKDGNEITTSFTLPNEVATSYKCVVLDCKSEEYIQTITDCNIYRLKILTSEEIRQKNPLLNEVKELLISDYVLSLEKRLLLMQSMNATERYKYLITNYTCYFQQIPLTYIASYLGISLETLSRIRAKKII